MIQKLSITVDRLVMERDAQHQHMESIKGKYHVTTYPRTHAPTHPCIPASVLVLLPHTRVNTHTHSRTRIAACARAPTNHIGVQNKRIWNCLPCPAGVFVTVCGYLTWHTPVHTGTDELKAVHSRLREHGVDLRTERKLAVVRIFCQYLVCITKTHPPPPTPPPPPHTHTTQHSKAAQQLQREASAGSKQPTGGPSAAATAVLAVCLH